MSARVRAHQIKDGVRVHAQPTTRALWSRSCKLGYDRENGRETHNERSGMDQGPAGDPGRGRRARAGGGRRPHRRIGRRRRRAENARRQAFRGRRPRGAAGADQHPPPFLPDAHPRGAGRARPRTVSLADDALSDLGRADAGSARSRRHGGDGGADAVGLHHHHRSSLSVPRRTGRGRGHRDRGGTTPRPARAVDARLDEPVTARRRPAARQRGAGRGHDPGRQRARGVPLS